MNGDRVPLCSSKQVCNALARAGFEPRSKSSRGSHQAWVKKVPDRTYVAIVVLGKREIPRGTLRRIIEQAGLSVAEFNRLLD